MSTWKERTLTPGETGIDELRRAVRVLNACEEAFNQRYTAEQLLQIVRMHMRSEWTVFPDRWTDRQVNEALYGDLPPRWNLTTGEAEYVTEREFGEAEWLARLGGGVMRKPTRARPSGHHCTRCHRHRADTIEVMTERGLRTYCPPCKRTEERKGRRVGRVVRRGAA